MSDTFFQVINIQEFEKGKEKKCNACNEKIFIGIFDYIKNPITTRIVSAYYHFKCYKPRVEIPLMIKNIKDPIPEDFISKIQKWNSKFTPPKLSSLLKPGFYIEKTPSYFSRVWLQVFKFFTPLELCELSLVCKNFYSYTWAKEIWVEITGIIKETVFDIKFEYLFRKFNICAICECDVIENLYYNWNIKRCLCGRCSKKSLAGIGRHKFSLRTLGDLMKKYRVDRAFFDRNNIKIVVDTRFYEKTYPALVEKALENDQEKPQHIMVTRKKRKTTEDNDKV
ncbi:hypothetical protein SteCoe_574 [Stentor coeruleus]|uniref:F-box domain-containing protein n=1 Tax=Stentor coeruleus TaxID=5963 RepID=A0A1R2D3L6_9CILI|nr:hypothetical protein SteCoe_574 [Stentor coeruleus]